MDNVIKALERILKVHEASGRHEINRTDLAAAIQQLKDLAPAAPERAASKVADLM